jgi:GT2 family glycosyltransferase
MGATKYSDDRPKTVVIMPVHNALEYVKRSLSALKDLHLVLVIVDDASDSETSKWLTSYALRRPLTHVLRNNRQQLFTRTVNRGLRYAYKTYAPQYLCVVNSDVEFFSGWLTNLEQILDTYPEVGKVAYRDSTEPNLPEQFENVEYPGYLTGHCFMVRTNVLEQVGVLCETELGGAACVFPELAHLQGLAHIGSDRYLTYNIQKAGYRTVYCNFPGVGHEAGKSWGHRLDWLAAFNLDPLWDPNNTL